MQKLHHQPAAQEEPQTAGITLHQASHYDLFERLMGMGVDRSNSRMVIELANIRPGDTVLDVACGTGSLTLTAQTYAGPHGKVYGIDASPEMIDFARQRAVRIASPVIFQLGLAEKLDFPASTFDVVISRLAIHHLPDDLKRKAFAEILRVLKPGGRLLIADFRRPDNHLLSLLLSPFIGGHMLQTDVRSLPPMLASAGFVEVNTGRTRSSLLDFVSGKKPLK